MNPEWGSGDRRFTSSHPGPWEPGLDGKTEHDLDALLAGWIGGEKPITILDLSGVPSGVLERLVGSILKIIYESLFWSREKSECGIARPLLVVMEETHRYLSSVKTGLAAETVQRIGLAITLAMTSFSASISTGFAM